MRRCNAPARPRDARSGAAVPPVAARSADDRAARRGLASERVPGARPGAALVAGRARRPLRNAGRRAHRDALRVGRARAVAARFRGVARGSSGQARAGAEVATTADGIAVAAAGGDGRVRAESRPSRGTQSRRACIPPAWSRIHPSNSRCPGCTWCRRSSTAWSHMCRCCSRGSSSPRRRCTESRR